MAISELATASLRPAWVLSATINQSERSDAF